MCIRALGKSTSSDDRSRGHLGIPGWIAAYPRQFHQPWSTCLLIHCHSEVTYAGLTVRGAGASTLKFEYKSCKRFACNTDEALKPPGPG
mmetsp:Transcript_57597/g.134875  ORF Transcript_57597/g.134875 Transcript_57597/m.134875 type:complete len:89 (-) Transcript_57597:41-307(-)